MIKALATSLLLLGAIISSAAWSASTSGSAERTSDVTGFRSASFGLSLKRVLDAIKNDFGKSADQVGRTVFPIERTQLLTIVVDGLLPVGGPARVTYIIGYESKSLAQINVAWGQLANSETSQEDLLAAGNLLTGYFSIREFAPEQTIQNQPMSDGSIVLFKGSGQENRTVLLRLLTAPRSQATDETDRGTNHDSLMLSYLREPENPDVFRIEPGKF